MEAHSEMEQELGAESQYFGELVAERVAYQALIGPKLKGLLS